MSAVSHQSWLSEVLDYIIILNRTDPERAKKLALRIDPNLYRQNLRVSDGCRIMIAGNQPPVVYRAGELVILGTVHARGDRHLDLETDFQHENFAATLLETIWGDYLAVWLERRSNDVHILRGPLGRLPCYCQTIDASLVFVSRCRRLAFIGRAPSVSKVALVSHLAGQGAKSRATCLERVGELVGGQQIISGPRGRRTETVWSPWTFATREISRVDRQSQTRAVRSAILTSTRQLVDNRSKVLLGLSGGLDSSIVAIALAEAGTSLECLSLTTGDPSGDESHYAQAITDAIGCNLLIARQSPESVDLSISAASSLPRPNARSFSQAGDKEIVRVIRDTGAQAFFNGGGGDSVFCHMHSAMPLLDRFHIEGLGRGLWDTAKDIDAITGCGTLLAARRAAVRALGKQRPYAPPLIDHFLTAEALEIVRPWDHPWFADAPSPLPGKQMHAYWIVSIENYLEGYARDQSVPSFYPLMTQPVVEACLAVPTWQWMSGGINRSIARQAFATELPPMIRDRKTKGAMDGLVVQIYEHNRTIIRERLLDGRLSSAGIINRDAVMIALDKPGPVAGDDYGRIMALIDAESWWESWC